MNGRNIAIHYGSVPSCQFVFTSFQITATSRCDTFVLAACKIAAKSYLPASQ